jgi:hypothetical protein
MKYEDIKENGVYKYDYTKVIAIAKRDRDGMIQVQHYFDPSKTAWCFPGELRMA